MRFTFFALCALAASAIAAPLVERQDDSDPGSSPLDSLVAKVTKHDASINSTLANLAPGASSIQKGVAGVKVVAQLVEIAAALDAAVNDMHTEPQLWVPSSDCDSTCTFGKVQGLVYEVGFTVKALIVRLDLKSVIQKLAPLEDKFVSFLQGIKGIPAEKVAQLKKALIALLQS